MEKTVQVNTEEIIAALLAENVAIRSYVVTTAQLLIEVLSAVHGISRKKAEKVFYKLQKGAVSFEQERMLLNIGAYDKEIQDLISGDKTT